jgi:hypothetical protein
MTDLKELLTQCADWFHAAMDGQEGLDWQNGESDKYAGDAWDEAEELRKRIAKIIDRRNRDNQFRTIREETR